MNSIVLEYRLYKNELSFEPLYHYTSLGLDEVLARRECEFFVKDGMTYKQRSSALEGDQYFLLRRPSPRCARYAREPVFVCRR